MTPRQVRTRPRQAASPSSVDRLQKRVKVIQEYAALIQGHCITLQQLLTRAERR